VAAHTQALVRNTPGRERQYLHRRQRVPLQALLKTSGRLLPEYLLKQSWFCSWFISLIDGSIKYQR
jgi:hypothetical protein